MPISNTIFRAALSLVIAGLGAIASPAEAQKDGKYMPWFNERFQLLGGGWFTFSDTDLGVRDNTTGDFVGFDLEDGLGLDDFTPVPWVRGELRFFNRNRIIAEYSESDRRGNAILDEDLDIDGGGTVIPAGSGARTIYKLRYVRTAYAFSIVKRDRLELAIAAGVHFLDFDLKLTELTVSQDEEGFSDGTGFSAPLPNVGMDGGWAINDRFAVIGGFSWLQADIGSISGGIWTGSAGLQMHVLRYFDLGLRYQFLGLNVDQTENGVKAAIDSFAHGPVVYGAVRF